MMESIDGTRRCHLGARTNQSAMRNQPTWLKFPIPSFYYPWFYWFSRRNRRQPLCHLKIMHRNWIMQVLFHAVFIIHTIEDNFSSWFRFTDSWRVIYNGTIKPLQLVIHVDMGSWRGINWSIGNWSITKYLRSLRKISFHLFCKTKVTIQSKWSIGKIIKKIFIQIIWGHGG